MPQKVINLNPQDQNLNFIAMGNDIIDISIACCQNKATFPY